MSDLALGFAAAIVVVAATLLVGWWLLGRRRTLGSPADLATYATLHAASLAAPALRGGLDPDCAARSLRHLRDLLGTPTVAIFTPSGVLAWDGPGTPAEVQSLTATALHSGRTQASGGTVVAPLSVEERTVGLLVVRGADASAGLVRATTEVARWMSSQLELAELSESRAALVEAELRALRAQISPHFVYNSLGAIA